MSKTTLVSLAVIAAALALVFWPRGTETPARPMERISRPETPPQTPISRPVESAPLSSSLGLGQAPQGARPQDFSRVYAPPSEHVPRDVPPPYENVEPLAVEPPPDFKRYLEHIESAGNGS